MTPSVNWPFFKVAFAVIVLRLLVSFVRSRVFSTIRYVPGPKPTSFIFGSLKDIWKADRSTLCETWAKEYGHVVKYTTFMGVQSLYTIDHKALHHVLTNSDDYPRLEALRWSFSRLAGEGLVFVEGEKHRLQRRIMNPAFGPSKIRDLSDVLLRKAAELRDFWAAECMQTQAPVTVDCLRWLRCLTLDIIGAAAFNHSFDSLSQEVDLDRHLATGLVQSRATLIMDTLRFWLPILRKLPLFTKRDKALQKAKSLMEELGSRLINERKATLQKDGNPRARDSLSLLVKANMLNANQRMTDYEVISQVATLLIAGRDTTSVALVWTLHSLSHNLQVQKRLREELFSVNTELPTMDDLNSLPYLGKVVQETLRLHPPTATLPRVAAKDGVLPLSNPYTDTRGVAHSSLRISKGQTIDIPIMGVNLDKSVWGDDAFEFRPDRWDSSPQGVLSVPGVWGHILTFIGGQHACIGVRFALIEMKAVLFILVRAFEFEPAVPLYDVTRTKTNIDYPFLRSNPEAGSQLPLLVRRYGVSEEV